MQLVTLKRIRSTDEGTFGVLTVKGQELFSGELPWRDNKKFLSCIPVGEYEASFTWSPKFQKHTYELLSVPGRSAIRIHSANFVGDKSKGFKAQVDGCIALGMDTWYHDNQWALLRSAEAVRTFENLLGKAQRITIQITEEYIHLPKSETSGVSLH